MSVLLIDGDQACIKSLVKQKTFLDTNYKLKLFFGNSNSLSKKKEKILSMHGIGIVPIEVQNGKDMADAFIILSVSDLYHENGFKHFDIVGEDAIYRSLIVFFAKLHQDVRVRILNEK